MSAETQTDDSTVPNRFDVSPTEVPDFDRNRPNKEWIMEMCEWLDDRINRGEPRSPYTNPHYHMVSTRVSINHWEYERSPTLVYPDTMEPHGAHCITVSMTGTRQPGTGFDGPAKPKTERARAAWNLVATFAEATEAEIQTDWSPEPDDGFRVYLFYEPTR